MFQGGGGEFFNITQLKLYSCFLLYYDLKIGLFNRLTSQTSGTSGGLAGGLVGGGLFTSQASTTGQGLFSECPQLVHCRFTV